MSTIRTKPADTKQQSQSVANKETPQNVVPKLDAAPKFDAKSKTDAQAAPVTPVTKVGLGFPRYLSTPLPTPGEQITKVPQQPQTPKKERDSSSCAAKVGCRRGQAQGRTAHDVSSHLIARKCHHLFHLNRTGIERIWSLQRR